MDNHPRNPRLLSEEQLSTRIEQGEIDTVVVAFTDMQGRLQGKRLHARYFLDEVLHHATEGCNYLLAVDVDMNTVPGYAISSWDTGYGDMMFTLDLDTIRLLPWLPGTAMIQCDLTGLDGTPVSVSPRAVLSRQIGRAAEAGFNAFAGTELEFILFTDTYEAAHRKRYTGLLPANQYNIDYSILGTTRVEPLLRDIRNSMFAAGLTVESAKGECNFGQHEIAFRYADVLSTADNHVVYKNGAKEIAALHGESLTFMAKFNEREGNSCHIHLSLRGPDGELVFVDDTGNDSDVYRHFVAGILATLPEFTLLYAPNINSYKRFAAGSFAPTTVAWGRDNRTCAVRLVGTGAGARLENRVPGGDVNPYLAIAGMLAGGLHGIEQQLELEPELVGNAYDALDRPQVPATLRDARDAFRGSTVAAEAFGDDVVEHYAHAADVEIAAFDAAVTDWELQRGFERL